MRAPITAIAREQEHHHHSDATTVTPSANRYLSAPGGHMVFLSDADHKWNDFRLWFIADASWVCNKNDIDIKSTSESKDPWKPWHGPGVSYVVPLVFGRCHNGRPSGSSALRVSRWTRMVACHQWWWSPQREHRCSNGSKDRISARPLESSRII